LGAFALSCLPAFLILIPAPVFCLFSVPGCLRGQPAFLPKNIKRLNEPNFEIALFIYIKALMWILSFFKNQKRTQFNPIFMAKTHSLPRLLVRDSVALQRFNPWTL
jgi:hypothetical protein